MWVSCVGGRVFCSRWNPYRGKAVKENRDLWSIHDICTALQKLKENEKSARFEARLAALNLEQTQIRADMEMLYVRDDE